MHSLSHLLLESIHPRVCPKVVLHPSNLTFESIRAHIPTACQRSSAGVMMINDDSKEERPTMITNQGDLQSSERRVTERAGHGPNYTKSTTPCLPTSDFSSSTLPPCPFFAIARNTPAPDPVGAEEEAASSYQLESIPIPVLVPVLVLQNIVALALANSTPNCPLEQAEAVVHYPLNLRRRKGRSEAHPPD